MSAHPGPPRSGRGSAQFFFHVLGSPGDPAERGPRWVSNSALFLCQATVSTTPAAIAATAMSEAAHARARREPVPPLTSVGPASSFGLADVAARPTPTGAAATGAAARGAAF